MSAVVLPFPLLRRCNLLRRNLARIAEARPKTADKLIAHTINVQVETMARRGIAPQLIDREAKALGEYLKAGISGCKAPLGKAS